MDRSHVNPNETTESFLFLQERPAERGRLHPLRQRHQPGQVQTRRDHQPAEERRGASRAGGGVRAAARL